PGRHDPDPDALVPGLGGRGRGDRVHVAVVGQQYDPSGPGRPDGDEKLRCGRIGGRSAGDHDRALRLEQGTQSGPGRDHHQAPGIRVDRRLRDRGGVLVFEPGYRDLVRATGLDSGLDGRTDVVDVDVDVPHRTVPCGFRWGTNHDERVAEPGELLLEPVDRLAGCVQQVLHLVR